MKKKTDAEKWGKFPELSHEENEEIWKARNSGFAAFFPAFPDAETQAKNTLQAARKWNDAHST